MTHGTDPNTLTSVNNIELLLHKQGDLSVQTRYYARRFMNVRREKLGNRHPDTLTSIYNLGSLLVYPGDLVGAAPLMRKALHR